MKGLDNVDEMINEMREKLYKIMQEKQSLLDEEVIYISQELDIALNEYHNLITEIAI